MKNLLWYLPDICLIRMEISHDCFYFDLLRLNHRSLIGMYYNYGEIIAVDVLFIRVVSKDL